MDIEIFFKLCNLNIRFMTLNTMLYMTLERLGEGGHGHTGCWQCSASSKLPENQRWMMKIRDLQISTMTRILDWMVLVLAMQLDQLQPWNPGSACQFYQGALSFWWCAKSWHFCPSCWSAGDGVPQQGDAKHMSVNKAVQVCYVISYAKVSHIIHITKSYMIMLFDCRWGNGCPG